MLYAKCGKPLICHFCSKQFDCFLMMVNDDFYHRLTLIEHKKDAIRAGLYHCFGVPAIGLGSSMLGYAAMVSAQDHPAWLGIAGAALIWGLPGQVAMIEMASINANFILALLAVSFANMRMLPLTLTGITLVAADHKLNWLSRYFLSHFLAVTGWTAMMLVKDHLRRDLRLYYYLGFSGLLFASGIGCAIAGYYGGQRLPDLLVSGLVFLTPLYLLLLVFGARHRGNLIAVILGAAGGLMLYPLIGDWAVLVVGVMAGTAGWSFSHFSRIKPDIT